MESLPHSEYDRIIKRQSKLSFKSKTQHYNDVSVYRYDEESTNFNKPIYLGFSVIELVNC